MNFHIALMTELLAACENNYTYQENYDPYRFGELSEQPTTLKGAIRKTMVRTLESRGYSVALKNKGFNGWVAQHLQELEPYLADLQHLYELLADEGSKRLLLQLIAYRVLGLTKVKLPLNTPEYWEGIRSVEALMDETKFVEAPFMNWRLPLIDLHKKGTPVRLHFLPIGAYTDFVLKQYEFRSGSSCIKADEGDYVIDAGGCWGDTALYFASEVGETGRVFTYEFIPSNLRILKTNLSLNPSLKDSVQLIERPVWESSGETMYYIDNGPGSRVFMKDDGNHDGKVLSLSIDDLVAQYGVPRVDFIKMDIEGAEPYALRGAVRTIARFKPKLAIAIYHSMSDFVNIPKFIDELGLGYELHLAHCSIHEEETILFAQIPRA